MDKILVTGGKGFIGTHLVRRLRCDFIDLVDGDDIRDVKLKDYDIVYHLAALRSIPRSFKQAREFFDTNVWGTYNIFRQAKRMVNISSSSVGRSESPYAISKKCAEAICPVNLRLFNVFGEGQVADTIIPIFAKAMLNNEDIYIYGDGEQVRDFTYIDDVIENIINFKGEGTHDIGYGERHSVNEVFTIMADFFKYEKSPIYLPERRGDFRESCAKDKMTGIGFKEGLIRTLRWWNA